MRPLSILRHASRLVYEKQSKGLLPPPGRIQIYVLKRGKGGSTQDIALTRACELRIDVLLLQEPWWSERTKTHPYYDLHLPFGGDNIRPRAVTNVKKDPKRIITRQIYPLSPTGDYCWVEVNKIMFLNVYKAPHDPCAVRPLLEWTPTTKTIAIGDFNSVYWAWQPSASSYYSQGEEIDRWAETHRLTCLIIGKPTHRAGYTLDLAWTNVKDTMAWVCKEECMTSDHLSIYGFAPNFKNSTAASHTLDGKLRISEDNIPLFTRAVSQGLPQMTTLDTIEETEQYAQDLC